jgi:hypothetical protein
MARRKNKPVAALDYHEGLSVNQVKIILTELNLDIDKFNEWMFGQTCPVIHRTNDAGLLEQVGGVYEYDLFRWIENQKKGTALIFD